VTIEVGCGTGHWLRELAGVTRLLVGLDVSWGMLARAREPGAAYHLVRADAARLPLATAIVDRVVLVNVLHHIPDHTGFFAECRRVLRAGGGVITFGLDPHSGTDEWWIYDYFPEAHRLDVERYPSAPRIREMLAAAGFRTATTEVAEHFRGDVPLREARARGRVDRRATSQLMVISDENWQRGVDRLSADDPILHTDLRLFATSAWTA
jgi:SAM-dependent methyltransferase